MQNQDGEVRGMLDGKEQIMKQWWLNLAERERRILLFGTAAVLFALLYWGGWAPLQQHLQQSRHQVQQLQQQLNWMHQQAPCSASKTSRTDKCRRRYRHSQCTDCSSQTQQLALNVFSHRAKRTG